MIFRLVPKKDIVAEFHSMLRLQLGKGAFNFKEITYPARILVFVKTSINLKSCPFPKKAVA